MGLVVSNRLDSQQLVQQLGLVTRRDPQSGLVHFNTPLLNTLLAQPQQTLPELNQFLGRVKQPLQIVEGLYLAQQLAERVDKQALNPIYATAAKRFNDSSDPLVQTYLAGFYRKLNEPSAFGPLTTMLLKNTTQAKHTSASGVSSQDHWKYPAINANEEIGGAMLSLIASQAADKLYAKMTANQTRY